MQLIKTSRDALLKPLANCVGIVERRHTLPILANVLLRKEGEHLHFLATDVEIQIATQAICEAGESVSTTVAARKLLDIVKALPEGNEVSLNYDQKKLTVQSGKARFSVQTLDATDFPAMQAPAEWVANWTMPQKMLKHLFTQVFFSMAQQDIRYYLNGLLLSVEGNIVRVVATDGHRLAYCETSIDGINLPKLDLIVPRKTVLEMMRQLDDSDAVVDIKASTQMIQFDFSGHSLMSKLIEGKFPDYNKVIPKNHPKIINLNRIVLQSALQRAAIMTTDKFKGVRLTLETNKMLISASNADQEEASDELDIDYADAELDIGFNVTYLMDVLSNLKTENIQLQFNDSNASALLTLADDNSFKYVVMPMRI
jgi:DNA polymerase III subunit beta